jgi:hypothetical protein
MPANRLLHPRCGHSQKVTALSDFVYRVWTQYLLSADDFGVMRATAAPLQEGNDVLALKKPIVVQRALDLLVTIGLLQSFEHQGRRYVYQTDWQSWQHIDWPRATIHPKPNDDAVARCDAATRKLFSRHPGGKVGKHLPRDSATASRVPREVLPETLGNDFPIHANANANANGSRLVAKANGSEAQPDMPPMDVWARELVALYPEQGRCSWHLVERPLFTALTDAQITDVHAPNLTPVAAWEALKARLEQHKRSYQWRVKQMIPRLDQWLYKGLYLQTLPESASGSEASSEPEWLRNAKARKAQKESATS